MSEIKTKKENNIEWERYSIKISDSIPQPDSFKHVKIKNTDYDIFYCDNGKVSLWTTEAIKELFNLLKDENFKKTLKELE